MKSAGDQRSLPRGLAEGRMRPAEAGAWAAIARRIDAEVQETLARLVRHTTELAVAAAEALIGAQPSVQRTALESAMREAIASLVGAVRLEIVVHPSQADVVRELTSQLARHLQVTVQTDENLTPGGCLVRSDLGEIDATMESRLRRLREALSEEVDL